jgi:hypothetical protein
VYDALSNRAFILIGVHFRRQFTATFPAGAGVESMQNALFVLIVKIIMCDGRKHAFCQVKQLTFFDFRTVAQVQR